MLRLCLILLCLASPPPALAEPASSEPLTVFAAASLKNAVDDLAELYQAETGQAVTPVYGASSTLARQIAAGAPADLYISANRDWMAWLVSQNAADPESRRDIAGNRLVVIGHGANLPLWTELPDLSAALQGGRLATALIRAVPAGIYARAALDWAGVPSDLPLAQAVNVRAALALVARGEAPLGIVYASDALAEPSITALFTFPPEAHPTIRYPAATTSDAPQASDFLDFLTSPRSAKILAQHGFPPPA